MTLEKAIEIKGRTGVELENTDPDDIDEADRLSKEALRRINSVNKRGDFVSTYLLPGETEN